MDKGFESWAAISLHNGYIRVGFVTEAEIAGAKMLRIDLPVGKDEVDQDIMVTEYHSARALVSMAPMPEKEARLLVHINHQSLPYIPAQSTVSDDLSFHFAALRHQNFG